MSTGREEAESIMDGWSDPEGMADLAAEELARALTAKGIHWTDCYADNADDPPGFRVALQLGGIHAAEAMMVLAVPGYGGPGNLYDRATSGCVTMAHMVELAAGDLSQVDPSDADRAVDAGWVWVVHPDMRGHVPGWHVMVTMPTADANTVTSRLNSLPGGAW